ncbi:oxidoreductase (plasmid) [Arthrobacter sp. StoSoilB13]|nr:oxidoreductase [Arthrobacter sp. StoSoilB13]
MTLQLISGKVEGMNKSTLSTTALTVLRVIAGFLFAAHGWQKFNEFTIAGTQASFAQMGVPGASAVAPVVATLELVGGIALILGLLTRVFAALLAIDMLGALFLVHAPAGVFVANGGYELVLLFAGAALALALAGAGKISADNALFGRSASKLRVLA